MNLHPETSQEANQMKHSTYYHSYFEGYTEARVPANNKAGYKLVRTYTADYLSMKDPRPLLRKVKYFGLFLAGAVLFLLSAIPATSANTSWYVALPTALSFFCLFLTGIFLLFFISWPKKMTIYQFSYSNKLQISSLCACILLGATALTSLLSIIVDVAAGASISSQTSTILSLIGFAASGVLILFLYLYEYNNTYTRVKNDAEGPEEGNYIC